MSDEVILEGGAFQKNKITLTECLGYKFSTTTESVGYIYQLYEIDGLHHYSLVSMIYDLATGIDDAGDKKEL